MRHNGYRLWKGKELNDFKLHFVPDIDFGNKIHQLGLFDCVGAFSSTAAYVCIAHVAQRITTS